MIENNKKTPIKSDTNVRMTEKYKYRCEYCSKKYKPKRRRIQKYCSPSCRSKAYRARQLNQPETQPFIAPTKTSIEKMSLPGIGNAAAGTALVEAAKLIFTSEENKAATKADIKMLNNNVVTKEDFQKLKNKIGRYHRILNMKPRLDGNLPYYDMETNKFVFKNKYFNPNL